ncbi:Hsp20/alpha crystallin family protein [Thiohalomonas denitrificans]|uniref:Hsp20/alpha crystallin family protein n=1 Tax=Thiohalomonas denitrificans TaxID=415747 RepID=UPI0026EC9048|nr:Hsp20/alpha crystallin family protein [Thiohalomonas denitrificans]
MAEENKQEITTRRESQMPQRMLAPFEEMERMFENFFPTGWLRPMRTAPLWGELAPVAKIPPVDIIDREEEIVLRAEIPGVDKDSIDVSLSDNSVTIRGSSHHEEKESEENYYRSEISRGAFSRTISLPADVDGDKTKATFKEGVLELTMPKVERSKRHSIKVE